MEPLKASNLLFDASRMGGDCPDATLLEKLHSYRIKATQKINDEMEARVERCLAARSSLVSVEEANRILKQELRSLTARYEALLEKNRNDSEIITSLKDSEFQLRLAIDKRENAKEMLASVRAHSKDKSKEREKLEDERAKIVAKTRSLSNKLKKINARHQALQRSIEEQHRVAGEERRWCAGEVERLRSSLEKADLVLKTWRKTDHRRDEAVRKLRGGERSENSKDSVEGVDDGPANPTENEVARENTESGSSKERDDSSETDPDSAHPDPSPEDEPAESDEQGRWSKSKTACEMAEMQNDHLTEFYEQMNDRLKEMNIELLCVRQWRLDREAEKRDLRQRVETLETVVVQKRRQKPVPPRTEMKELILWIENQRERNTVFRNLLWKLLKARTEGFKTYSQFVETVKKIKEGEEQEGKEQMKVSENTNQVVREENKEDSP